LISNYGQRIARLTAFELIETREARGLSDEEAEKARSIEGEYLKRHLKDDYLVCLTDRGKEMTSEEFSHWLRMRLESNSRPLAFIIGGHAGLADDVLDRANELLSLSKMTLSHEVARLVLLEQIYRALTQMKGWPYAK